ncbi:hypothetical protein GWK47_051170 [Chionoecetes opilio]|uniref:Uncharacterized protein n=1 Tax=Chionoecetes opilio TaxID=41210 RepID=A0A8J4Y9C2_CHIOP|nr:hypothetical protein GWK47_051170 [Chionoecetes opilio]
MASIEGNIRFNEVVYKDNSGFRYLRNDGPIGGPPGRSPRRGDPADHEPLLPQNHQLSVRADADAKALAVAEAKPDPTKNKPGSPVYYPPGHELFHETMHTMTLKDGRRRGKAKWRMEKSAGYKESGSSSESKGGMAMVPVCLPLCCGAACVHRWPSGINVFLRGTPFECLSSCSAASSSMFGGGVAARRPSTLLPQARRERHGVLAGRRRGMEVMPRPRRATPSHPPD